MLVNLNACAPAAPPSATVAGYPFVVTTTQGVTVSDSDLRGAWVILNFWATWCIPCVVEMPTLQALTDQHRSRLIVLGINVGESATQVADFAAQHGLSFPLVAAPPAQLLLDYQVSQLPQTVVLDPRDTSACANLGHCNSRLLRLN
jgi:cytochrome c biogenesis protein CcmG, thiol:disulfide interchange protein DsbE